MCLDGYFWQVYVSYKVDHNMNTLQFKTYLFYTLHVSWRFYINIEKQGYKVENHKHYRIALQWNLHQELFIRASNSFAFSKNHLTLEVDDVGSQGDWWYL